MFELLLLEVISMCNKRHRQLEIDFGMEQLEFDFNAAVVVDGYDEWFEQQIDIEFGRYECEGAFIVKNF